MSAKRILIADDEKRIRLVLRETLEAEGYEVREAADGLEAMDAIVQWAPDVMILDMAMPNLDGMRTLAELKDVNRQFKPHIIMLTAFGSIPAAIKAIGLGVSAFVEKPIRPEMLREVVKRALIEQNDDTATAEDGPRRPPRTLFSA